MWWKFKRKKGSILAMTLLVRDEEDIISENIEYHKAQGVDVFIIMDNLSRDKTTDIVRKHRDTTNIELINQIDDDYDQSKWVTEMARLAYTNYNADWVINNDADEFWVPKEGTLKSTLESQKSRIGGLKVKRKDAVLTKSSNDFTDMPFYSYMNVFDRLPLNTVGRPIGPKVCHRGSSSVIVKAGNHGLKNSDLNIIPTDEIYILHFPKRNFEQFKNKIVLGGAAFERNTTLSENTGRTWKTLYKEWQNGELENIWDSYVVAEDEVESRLKSGDYFIDNELVNFFRR